MERLELAEEHLQRSMDDNAVLKQQVEEQTLLVHSQFSTILY